MLKISSDNNTIINIEIKSRQVDDLEKIKKQLCQNIHYLSHIAAEIFSFTYMQCNDSAFKIFRYDSNKLKESTIDELLECIKKIDKARDNYIEKLFRPTEYLISPFNKPKEFLNEKYYLSSPQEEVKQKIIENIHKGKSLLGINGAAGTGKSLLLYDIAKTLSKYYSVIIIHCGKLNEGHNELNTAFKKDFIINAKSIPQIMLTQYQIVCVDETQRLHSDQLTLLLKAFNEKESNILGIIFSYDPTQYLSVNEVERANCSILQNNPTFKEFNLSKKIRTNKELSHFIENIMDLAYKPNEKVQYKNIDIIYANVWGCGQKPGHLLGL